MERIVSLYLDYAELQAERQIPMSMEDWDETPGWFLGIQWKRNPYRCRKNQRRAGKTSCRDGI